MLTHFGASRAAPQDGQGFSVTGGRAGLMNDALTDAHSTSGGLARCVSFVHGSSIWV